MNEIIYNRLKEICPSKTTRDMSVQDLICDCNVAFKIIGYSPENLEESVIENLQDKDMDLYKFIYTVWENSV